MTTSFEEMLILAQGAGGSKKQSQPEIAPDSTRSTAKGQILYLIGEGDIEGFPTAELAKSVYFDDVVVQRPSGKFNYKEMSFGWRRGTQDQPPMGQGYSNVYSEVNVGQKILKNTPIVQTVTDPDVDAVRFRLMIPALQNQKDSGDVVGTKLEFAIKIASFGQPFVTKLTETIDDKASSPFQIDYDIKLTGSAPWQIQVQRITDDSDRQTLQNDLNWQAYIQITYSKLRYPNSALFGCRFNASQFKQIPQISLDLLGIRLWVPHNYNPTAKTYSGSFNGSLVRSYSNNPAWALYTILRDQRFGCGRFIDASQLDVWSFYSIGQYCDELVPNGQGGTEPRFTINAYIENRDDAYNILSAMASVFRGMIYWANGTIYAINDAPTSVAAARLYTKANVICEYDENGKVTKPPFVYSGTSLKTRHTVALVSWSDPKDGYKQKVEYVEDRDAILKYGVRQTEIVAFGCTSRGQASRCGKWLLFSEQHETETLSFSVATEGMLTSPGELIKVADPARSGNRWGGRILGSEYVSGVWEVILDGVIQTGQSGYKIAIAHSTGDNTEYECSVVNSTRVRVPGLVNTPTNGNIWILASSSVNPQLFKIVNIVENTDGTYEITAIAHDPSKYDFVEEDEPLVDIPITRLSDPTAPPFPVEILTTTLSIETLLINVNVTWEMSDNSTVTQYQLEYRISTDSDWTTQITGLTSATIADVQNDTTYQFRVAAITTDGEFSDYSAVASFFVHVVRGTAVLSIPIPRLGGQGIRTIVGSGSINIPVIRASGTSTREGVGAMAIAVPVVSGIGNRIRTGTGALILPTIQIAGVAPATSGPPNGWVRRWRADSGFSTSASAPFATWSEYTGSSYSAIQSLTSDWTPSLLSNAINGKSAIDFDGSNDFLYESGTYAVGTVVIVFAKDTTNFAGFDGLLTARPSIFPNKDASLVNSADTIAISGVLGTNKVYAVTPSLSDAYIDGASQNTTSIADFNTGVDIGSNTAPHIIQIDFSSSSNVKTFCIGCDVFDGPGSRHFNGKIGEVIIYPSTLSGTDRTQLNNYANSYWGFSI